MNTRQYHYNPRHNPRQHNLLPRNLCRQSLFADRCLGRFRIIEPFARGGCAELLLARDTRARHRSGHDGRPLVIKRLLPHLADDPEFRARFTDEARLSLRLTHPNIVATHEIGLHHDEPFIVLEYIDGIDLRGLIDYFVRRSGHVPPVVAAAILHQVLDALDYVHARVDDHGRPLGIVHRDVSPKNVLLSRHGRVKLIDFGLARTNQHLHCTQGGTIMGTYGYMSPEQVGGQAVDARSDIFSAAAILAEMLIGQSLFTAARDLDVLLMARKASLALLDLRGAHIPSHLDRILRKALQREPERRFSTARAFRDALARWLDDQPDPVDRAAMARLVAYVDLANRRRRRHARPQRMRPLTRAGRTAVTAQTVFERVPAS